MPEYREFAPPPRLSHAIECFWTNECQESGLPYRVYPDGCADIIFTRTGGRATIEVVGPMTRFRDFEMAADQLLVGVRFHPGMWTSPMRTPADRLTDQIAPLERLWGGRAGELRNRLAEASVPEQWIGLIASYLPEPRRPDSVQRSLAWMVARRGCVSLDDLADQSGMSVRQFRRVCLTETGLTPKFLARVLRFRNALARVREQSAAFAEVALDCGYYDQAHLINEFREFSGRTPVAFRDDRFFQSRQTAPALA